jgi:serine/threonine protein kinase
LDASQISPGQTVKNRYRIEEQLSADENAVVYLAKDKIAEDKKVLVRELTDDTVDAFTSKIFAEERTSLCRINHPNIVNVIDSGKSADGKSYLVNEYVEGETVKHYLKKTGQFNALRAARIVRQAADALSEAHQDGVLHRNLKPEDIILTVDENGMERVKLANFGAAKEKLDEKNLLYKSPEQVEGKIANRTSDTYSLAVIAYQMLTNHFPFNAASVGDLLRAQREGLKIRPSDLRTDLPASIDKVLEKALSFNQFDRFEKVRDFGDEFFSEIIASVPLGTDDEIEEISVEGKTEPMPVPAATATAVAVGTASEPTAAFTPTVRVSRAADSGVKATEDLAWEKRSPEMPNEPSPRRNLFSMLGVATLLIALLGVWYYFINRPAESFVETPAEEVVNQNAAAETSPITEANTNAALPTEEIETPPLARSITPPSNSVYFQNSKENLRGDALRNFLGFTLYYPKDWKVNKIEPETDLKSRSKFLDISKVASSGTPIEQFLVSYYNSKGTFNADSEIFQALVGETNGTLKKIVPNYEMVSKGEITVNNGWRAYEVKFKGTGKTANGENITLWGRRMFVPTAIRGMKNGYVITMLATSLSKEVKSIDDVGVKGDLSTILETFEPNQNF